LPQSRCRGVVNHQEARHTAKLLIVEAARGIGGLIAR
jgi:hypothetical protein